MPAPDSFFTSVSDLGKDVMDHIVHATSVAGEGALHAAADTAGFVGDVGVDAVKVAKNIGKKVVRSSEPPDTLDIPGFGPVSAMTQQSYEKAVQSYTKGQTPKPQNAFEQGLNIASRGAADVLAGGGEAAGPRALASGAAAGLAGSAVNDLTDSPGASAAAALITGLVTHAAPEIVSHVRTKGLMQAGFDHPDYEPLVNEVVGREGGGTFENPKVNPKSGAMGTMQVTPDTARDPGYGIRPWDGKSQADLARVGQQKFAVLLGKYNDPEKALAAYNWGEGNVDKAVKAHGDDWYYHAPAETQAYVAKSMLNVYGGPRSVSSGGRGVPPIDINEAMGNEPAGMDPNIVNETDDPSTNQWWDGEKWTPFDEAFPPEEHDSGPSLMDAYDDPKSPHYVPDEPTRRVEVDDGKRPYEDSDLDNALLQIDNRDDLVNAVNRTAALHPRWRMSEELSSKVRQVVGADQKIDMMRLGYRTPSIDDPNLRDPAVQTSLNKIVDPGNPEGYQEYEKISNAPEEPTKPLTPEEEAVQKSVSKISDPNAMAWMNGESPDIHSRKVFLKEMFDMGNRHLSQMSDEQVLRVSGRAGYNKEWKLYYEKLSAGDRPNRPKSPLDNDGFKEQTRKSFQEKFTDGKTFEEPKNPNPLLQSPDHDVVPLNAKGSQDYTNIEWSRLSNQEKADALRVDQRRDAEARPPRKTILEEAKDEAYRTEDEYNEFRKVDVPPKTSRKAYAQYIVKHDALLDAKEQAHKRYIYELGMEKSIRDHAGLNDPVERDTNPPAQSSSFGTARPQMRNRAAPVKAPEGHPPEEPSPYEGLEPEQKLVKAIEDAKPLSREQRNAQHDERVARAAKVAGIMDSEKGLHGYRAAMKELKGSLPTMDYESIAHHFTEDDVHTLLNRIAGNNWLLPMEKVTAQTALMKLLGAEGGKVPTPSELKLLSHIYPNEMIDALMKNRPLSEKIWKALDSSLNLPRALMASFDLSAPLRQGVFMVGRKEFYPAFVKMFHLFASEKASRAMMDNIRNSPNYGLMRRAGLALTDPEGRYFDQREEAFRSQLAEKIPIIGRGVRASDRAYSGFLNKLRADTFDSLVKLSRDAGVDLEHDGKALKDIAKFINNATGRGDIAHIVEKNSHILNASFFSPRLIASRINLLRPDFYLRLSPVVRKEALKSLFSFSAIAMTALGLAKMGGASVNIDPTSPDFAKIRVGDTRWDVLGGLQQFIRFGAQLTSWFHDRATGAPPPKFGQKTMWDTSTRFARNKLSPVGSFIVDALDGKDTTGKPFNMGSETASRFIPLIAQDANDAYNEYGSKGLLYAVPGLFGVGVQTYQPKPPKQKGPRSIFDTSPRKPHKSKSHSVFVGG